MTTTTEQLEANKKLARDYIDQVFNQHNPSKAADFVTGGVVWHGNSLGDIAGAENLAGPAGDGSSGHCLRCSPSRSPAAPAAAAPGRRASPASALQQERSTGGCYPRPRDV